MTHKHGRTDANHAEIVAALRSIGVSVVSTADIGDGFPDLIAGYRGVNVLLEVKDGSKPPSRRKLTPDEIKFHTDWHGKIYTVFSAEDALNVVTLVTL